MECVHGTSVVKQTLKEHFYSWLPSSPSSNFMVTLKLKFWSMCYGFYSVKDGRNLLVFPSDFSVFNVSQYTKITKQYSLSSFLYMLDVNELVLYISSDF